MVVLLCILYLALFILVGCLLAALVVLPRETASHTFAKTDSPASSQAGLVLSLGCSFGLVLLEALPALFALLFRFGLLSALLAALTAALLGATAFSRLPPRCPFGHDAPEARFLRHRLLPFLLCVLPLFAVSCFLIHTHILCPRGDALWTGQSCYGDLPMHLAFIKSIAVQGSFPPSYPLLAEQAVFGYPFLCESVSSVFLVLGLGSKGAAGLRLSAILPMLPAFFAVYGMFFHLAAQVLGSAKRGALAFWLFFMGSGFGFLYFCGSPAAFKSIFTGFYTTPTNFVEENIRWVNPLVDLLLPQRATLFGWATLFAALYLLVRFSFEDKTRFWLPLGILAGSLPLVHTHSFLALAVISAVWFFRALLDTARTQTASAIAEDSARPQAAHYFRDSILPWLAYAALAALLACPQLFGVIFRQTGSGNNFLRFAFNWANEGDSYFWFYIKNIGIVYLLLIPAFLFAKKQLRWFYGGGLTILALAETVAFQPNLYDNNKLLFIWHALGCMLVAGFLCDLFARTTHRKLCAALLTFCVFLGTFGSVLTLGREAVSRYEQFDANDVSLAQFVEENTPNDALFCTGMQHLNPICSLAGRNILCGSTLYVFYHGMNYIAQADAVRDLYETPTEALLAEWRIDYLLISDWERQSYTVNENFYAARYPIIYADEDNRLYQISQAH